MKKILWTMALLNVMAFAIHPALEEAIDSKNYKQAENLVKNVGVKDVYCPQTLNAKDADRIYGDEFSKSIKSLLENCDTEFSKSYLDYKCAGGKDKPMCLNLVNLTDPYSWPDSYAKQFCTKKNVEICAAAVENIPVEKSVPYLKAIKANKLADMKEQSNKDFATSKKECKYRCELQRSTRPARIKDEIVYQRKQLADAARVLSGSALEARRASTELRIRDLEREEMELRSNNYCDKECSLFNQPESKSVKISYYYFERAFYALSQKAIVYYGKLNNPIIPELTNVWSIVDNLIETSIETFQKSLDGATDATVRSGILNEHEKRIGSHNYIIKKNVLDTLKSLFIKGEKIDEFDQLYYCKIYPSLEKETEKLFGTKVINCKSVLEENKKIFETCSEGDLLFDGLFKCVAGQYEYDLNGFGRSEMSDSTLLFTDSRDGKIYSKRRIGNLIWMADNLNFETPDSYCYDDKEWKCARYGRLYKWKSAKDACPNGWHLPSVQEMNDLYMSVGGKPLVGEKLKSKTDWTENGGGDDSYGFSAYPSGFRDEEGAYKHRGNYTMFWTSNDYEFNHGYAYYIFMRNDNKDAFMNYSTKRVSGSVRCVMNSSGVAPNEDTVEATRNSNGE